MKQGQRVRVLTNRSMWVYWSGKPEQWLGTLRGEEGYVRRRDGGYVTVRLDAEADITLKSSELEKIEMEQTK